MNRSVDGFVPSYSSPGPQEPATPFEPAPPPEDDFDWIRLVSGEWLKGEITVLSGDTLEFDSEELDDLSLDWEDVAELRSGRDVVVVLDNRKRYEGRVHVVDGEVIVTGADGETRAPRDDLYRMVSDAQRERDHWSGKLSLGINVREGNTDQRDVTGAFNAKRRTPKSRLDLQMNSTFSEVEGIETVDNQRLQTVFDLFLSPRFFVTPIGLELYRDPFQNIALRTTPYAGVGYAAVDRKRVEWDLSLGAGARRTEFESVEPGEDDVSTTATAVVGTTLDSDITKDVELDLSYQAQIGVDDVENTNQHLAVTLSVDLWWDLELDFSVYWDRVGQPEPDSDGNTPQKDDLRMVFGLAWDF